MHHINPFIQHAMRHGQRLISETNRAVEASQALVSTCDQILLSINSGNLQGAVMAAQNARNLASQVAQSTQELSQAINERLDMGTFVLGRIQQHVNELAGALQSMRTESGFYRSPWQTQSQLTPTQYLI
ncbi:MAG: hypothetical protein K6T66_15680 [Peptococcaceae bacterium]|nr:hypothetical protein [Peptococcaceae bacterium]